MTDSDQPADGKGGPGVPAGGSRRRVLLIAGAVAAVVAVVVGVVLIGDDDTEEAVIPSTSVTSTTEAAATTSTESSPTTMADNVEPSTTVAGDEEPSTTPATTPSVESADTTRPPQGTAPSDGSVGFGGSALPVPPAAQPTESAACAGVKEGLVGYRTLAVSTPIEDFIDLQLGMEEYESVTDFVGDGQDWSIRIVELLTLVRRDWSTAFAADGSGDTDVAEERLASALEFLDEAIAVLCPDE